MPVRTRFDSEEPEQPAAAAPAPNDAAAVEPASAPSPAPPSRPSPAPKRQSLAQVEQNGSPAKPKKRKVVEFDQDAEDEAHAARTNGDAPAQQPRKRGKWTPEQRKKAREDAARLLPGRQLLPVWGGRDAILEGIEKNDTVIVLADTGSGKTTQIPQFLVRSKIPCEAPRIVCTQPRRVAATSLAQRVSTEMGTQLGALVGYTVRFDDRTSRGTRLKYATDGALLAEMLGDRDLDAYDVVVLDEAHERSLRTDMLMGFLKDIQVRRKDKVRAWKAAKASAAKGKGRAEENGNGAATNGHAEERDPTELKIVVMSATIDAKRFSEFFDHAPVLYVQGRQHKVTVMYSAEPQSDYLDAALKTIFQIHKQYPPGSVLVFLPGQDEIESLATSIQAYLPDLEKTLPSKGSILVTPLYAKLPPAEQAKAFAPSPPNTRKIILATNIAETSVTIPGVKFVVDCGLAKEKRYHAGTGIDSLVTESISQSSAKQRAGRAGRESDGFCFRLYPEQVFNTLEKRTQPEIQRVSLTFALLHLLAAGQDDVFSFHFMDRPDKESILFALMTLHGLDALDKQGRITKLGRQMAQLPLDPVYARVLLSSFAEGCPCEIVDLVALLGSKDQLLINTAATREQANAARQKFVHRRGDHLQLLNILRAFEELTERDERKMWCRDNFVSYKAMLSVLDSRKQLRERVERLELGDWRQSVGDEDEPVLNALVGGLFANTALRQEDGTYRHTLTKQVVAIHPSSTMHNKKAPAILYDELVLTTKTYARGVSSIEPSQIRLKAPSMFAKTMQ
ncbi:Salivary acidic proline-rich phosphoprotein 1/2 [Rhodotorula kratochvilovae]